MIPSERPSSRIFEIRYFSAVRRIMELIREKSLLSVERDELEVALSEANKDKYTDTLTGLDNRRAFDQKLEILVEVAHQNNAPLAVIFVDIDGLKRVNDNHLLKHRAGDQVIKAAADALRLMASGPSDVAARLHGDELCLVLPMFRPVDGISSEELIDDTRKTVHDVTNALIGKLGMPQEWYIGASVGIAILRPGDTTSEILGRADVSLDSYKNARKQELERMGVVFRDDRLISDS